MRIVIADDETLLREGLARLLVDSGHEVVGKAGTAGELGRRVALTRPDVAIVDIRMPPTHTDEGLVAAQQIRRDHPAVGVLVLSHYVESRYAMRLLEEHPERSGYLLKLLPHGHLPQLFFDLTRHRGRTGAIAIPYQLNGHARISALHEGQELPGFFVRFVALP